MSFKENKAKLLKPHLSFSIEGKALIKPPVYPSKHKKAPIDPVKQKMKNLKEDFKDCALMRFLGVPESIVAPIEDIAIEESRELVKHLFNTNAIIIVPSFKIEDFKTSNYRRVEKRGLL